MFLGMNNTRLERKILIILDFENGFLPIYLPQCIEVVCFSRAIFHKELSGLKEEVNLKVWCQAPPIVQIVIRPCYYIFLTPPKNSILVKGFIPSEHKTSQIGFQRNLLQKIMAQFHLSNFWQDTLIDVMYKAFITYSRPYFWYFIKKNSLKMSTWGWHMKKILSAETLIILTNGTNVLSMIKANSCAWVSQAVLTLLFQWKIWNVVKIGSLRKLK